MGNLEVETVVPVQLDWLAAPALRVELLNDSITHILVTGYAGA